jgi:hypothetical protein
MGFAKDLETITDAQYLTAFLGKLDHRLHDRAETGDSTCTQVIAKRKSTR